jgi:16S rRNA (uracil1498-N3)-methyltransferase
VLSERVVVQVAARDADAKLEKWRQIAIESIKQCGSPWLPVIEPPAAFADVIKRAPHAALTFVSSLEPGSRSLRACIPQQTKPASAALWIGPEGDFTPAEYAAIRATVAHPITLGPLVLRADTAAIASLALLNHELQP